jgi:cytochrome c-type biogenesis protein
MITSLFSALWLGILTSISPCPLATNIAAVSYISKKVIHPAKVIFYGIFYTAGRMTTYFLLGTLISFSMVSVSSLAMGLQGIANKILGIVLIIVGLFLFDIFRVKLKFFSISHQKQQKLLESGLGGAFLLGIIFALSFCPISAALFFGSIIPITLKTKFMIGIPLVYGLGTAIPVVFFSILISLGAEFVSHFFKKATLIEKYAKTITGAIFIVIGIYYVLTHLLNIL